MSGSPFEQREAGSEAPVLAGSAGRLLPFIGREINRGPPGARRATISV